LGDEIEVMVLDIDSERRRVSLGIKQCTMNPWESFAVENVKGDKISGAIKSITDFGIFIGLPGGIDGLVHLSDLSWSESGEDAVRSFTKGDEVEAIILAIDGERERISLGIKQMSEDPYSDFVAANEKGSTVKGVVTEVDAKGALINLGDDIEGYIRASELSRDKVEDASTLLKVGDELVAKVINVDRKSRQLNLSIRAREMDDEKTALRELREQEAAKAGPSTIGDLIKAQMETKET
jgi:small subunit ribosomal protein S1